MHAPAFAEAAAAAPGSRGPRRTRPGRTSITAAGHALQRVDHVLVGHLAHVLGRDDRDVRVGLALLLERTLHRGADAADLDDLGGLGGRLLRVGDAAGSGHGKHSGRDGLGRCFMRFSLVCGEG